MTALVLLIAFLVTIDVVALRWGADTRRAGGDWQPRPSIRPCS